MDSVVCPDPCPPGTTDYLTSKVSARDAYGEKIILTVIDSFTGTYSREYLSHRTRMIFRYIIPKGMTVLGNVWAIPGTQTYDL